MPHPAPFDEDLIRLHYAALRLEGPRAMPGFLHARAAEEIAARLSAINRHFDDALICALGPASIRQDIAATGKTRKIHLAAPFARPRGGDFDCVLDLQSLSLEPRSLDLFISIFDLALVNDLPGALGVIRRALRPDGLFMAALPAGETLRELRAAWALADTEMDGEPALRVAPFCDLRQLGGLLQLAGFTLPVIDAERLTLRYSGALSLMEEIKALGWANPLRARPRKPVSRTRMARATASYETAFAGEDGRVSATFEIAHVCAWSPHGSQQKPLAPGAACTPLGAVLGKS